MFREVLITVPTIDFFIELVTAYFLIGFLPWFVWCISDVWRDYGRSVSNESNYGVFRISLAWIMWPLSIDVSRRNLTYRNKRII